jgi:hypothetical protein
MLRNLFVGAVLLAFAGCTSVAVYQPPEKAVELVRGYSPKPTHQIGFENYRRLSDTPEYPLAEPCVPEGSDCRGYRKPDGMALGKDWRWSDGSPGRPKMCLALSGGGLRSATFSIGVLKGLHEAGLLQKFDVMSSVSGGGYALSWYLAQNYWIWKNTNERGDPNANSRLFDLRGAHQRYLAENSDFYDWKRGLPPFTLAVAAIPLHLAANAVFGLHMNTSYMYNSYELRLREVYLAQPPAANENANPNASIWISDLARYGEAVARKPDQRIPYFIFNTTVLFDEGLGTRPARLLQNSVFEFGARQYGSDAFGRYRYWRSNSDSPLAPQREWYLEELVTLSGAALDFNQNIAHPSSRQLATVLNLDLGRYIPNPRLTRTPRQVALWWSPLAHIVGRDHYARDINGTHIYVSDGGHSENLGAFALVRRLCEEIVIVDAEYDPHYAFPAYFNLKRAIAEEMGAELVVNDIEKLRKSCHAVVGCEPSEAEKARPEQGRRWQQVGRKPVMTGTIRQLPYCEPRHGAEVKGWSDCKEPESKAELQVRYVKLGFVPDSWRDAEPPEEFVKDFCKESSPVEAGSGPMPSIDKAFRDSLRCEKNEKRRPHAPFPQLTTQVQSYEPELFAAYRNLGCVIGYGRLAPLLAGGSATPGPVQVEQACGR